jgi:hypothetical protein
MLRLENFLWLLKVPVGEVAVLPFADELPF